MSRFTTRVELYGNPSYEVYNTLHAAMEKRGFSRIIVFGTKKHWLPNAEYTSHGNISAKNVLELAKQAASTAWKDFGVLVTQTEVDREHYNLKSAE